MPGRFHYGTEHKTLRRQLAPFVASGQARCARCGFQIEVGEDWDLDHDDSDRTRYIGPSHQRCNRATAGRPNHKRDRHSRKW
jgi:hypothetical protein